MKLVSLFAALLCASATSICNAQIKEPLPTEFAGISSIDSVDGQLVVRSISPGHLKVKVVEHKNLNKLWPLRYAFQLESGAIVGLATDTTRDSLHFVSAKSLKDYTSRTGSYQEIGAKMAYTFFSDNRALDDETFAFGLFAALVSADLKALPIKIADPRTRYWTMVLGSRNSWIEHALKESDRLCKIVGQSSFSYRVEDNKYYSGYTRFQCLSSPVPDNQLFLADKKDFANNCLYKDTMGIFGSFTIIDVTSLTWKSSKDFEFKTYCKKFDGLKVLRYSGLRRDTIEFALEDKKTGHVYAMTQNGGGYKDRKYTYARTVKRYLSNSPKNIVAPEDTNENGWSKTEDMSYFHYLDMLWSAADESEYYNVVVPAEIIADREREKKE